MDWSTGIVYKQNLKAALEEAPIVVNCGGTRSGKTWGTLQALCTIAEQKRGKVISVVGETLPFLKRGAITDFRSMLGDSWSAERWNATDKIYTFPNGSYIEFFSADAEGKVHGSARDYLFINECYYIPFDIYRQLEVRTRRTIYLDYNPRSLFWVDEKILPRDGTRYIHTTFNDNPFLTDKQKDVIRSYKDTDPNWWTVYGEGKIGSAEGLVYKPSQWRITKEMPTSCRQHFYCIDFGFTNDPTAVLHVMVCGGELWVDELCYSTGMLNKDIAEILQNAGAKRNDSIVADSAEQKSIAEINNIGGYNITPTTKGKGSVVAGISIVQGWVINVTQRSLGIIEELRNYSWKRDINGNSLNVPVDRYNHSLDALRYGVTTFLQTRKPLSVPRMQIGRIC